MVLWDRKEKSWSLQEVERCRKERMQTFMHFYIEKNKIYFIDQKSNTL